MATYSKNLHHALCIIVMIFGILGLTFSYTTSQAYDSTNPETEHTSQNMNVLSANFAVVVPDALGEPTDIVVDDMALVSQSTISPDGSSLHPATKEDTRGIHLYTVQEGDTLSDIAELFDVTTNTIRWENGIGNTVKVGQELRILPVTGVTHTIQKGDTYGKIAGMYDVESDDITIFNNLDPRSLTIGEKIIVPNGIKKTETTKSSSSSSTPKKSSSTKSSVSSGYYIRPTTGQTSSTFGPRSGSYHYGIDFAVPVGTPVVAAASGVVTKTSCGSGYGICAVIQHDNGTQTLYAHNSALFVSVGKKVKQGQKIANSGNTGKSTGPHVHFEIQDIKTGAKKNPNFLK